MPTRHGGVVGAFWFTHFGGLVMQCPACGSYQVATKNHARRIGSAVGGAAGVAGGVTGRQAGAKLGASLGAVGGPMGMVLGGLSGALIGGLVGGVVGSRAGEAFGGQIDDTILNNCACLHCGYHFQARSH
jgi:hypothetical protein